MIAVHGHRPAGLYREETLSEHHSAVNTHLPSHAVLRWQPNVRRAGKGTARSERGKTLPGRCSKRPLDEGKCYVAKSICVSKKKITSRSSCCHVGPGRVNSVLQSEEDNSWL